MSSPVKLYQREMHENVGFFATWLPGDALEVGHVGTLQDGRFRQAASLKELGIPFQVVTSRSKQDLRYTSAEGTEITPAVGAGLTGVAKAEIKIEFSREGAFLFHAFNLKAEHLENRLEVAQRIAKFYEMGKWQKEWYVIETLQVAERGAIFVSEGTSAGVTVEASAAGPISAISLADPKVGLTVKSTRGRIVYVTGDTEVRPLYLCVRLETSLFGRPSVTPVRGTLTAQDEVPFVRPSISDLLSS